MQIKQALLPCGAGKVTPYPSSGGLLSDGGPIFVRDKGGCMLAIVQFPISDARKFALADDLRLPVPDWPDPDTGGVNTEPQFVHHFGEAVERCNEPDLAWPDENRFCLAKRALRLFDLGSYEAGSPGAIFRPKCAFRRLFFDGESVARVEIGLVHNDRVPRLPQLNQTQIVAIIQGLCALPVIDLEDPEREKKPTLIKQGPDLSKLYAKSTLSRKANAKADRAEKLVKPGNPLIVIELEPHEADSSLLPDRFMRVPSEKVLGANLAFGYVESAHGPVSAWILQQGKATKEDLRRLRLCLLRLHAEQEALDIILGHFIHKRLVVPPDLAGLDALDEYFNEKTGLINRSTLGRKRPIRQSAILSAYDAAEFVIQPAHRLNVIKQFSGAHRQVLIKIEDYQKRRDAIRFFKSVYIEPGGNYMDKSSYIGGNNYGNINIADTMSDVTNTVYNNLEKSSAKDNTKELMKQLAQQISDIAPKIKPEHALQLGSDVQRISNEMTMPTPNQDAFKLSLKGLTDAAEAVGKMAGPIIETVKLLMPLLLP